jgi:hypothetical protein
MSSWLLKTSIQRLISTLPSSHRWNGLLQRYVTKGLTLTVHGQFEAKLMACRRHFEAYQKFSAHPKGEFTAVEIGTGWFPIIPLGLFLCGANRVLTLDIRPLLSGHTVRQTLRCFRQINKAGQLSAFLPAVQPERIALLEKLESQSAPDPAGCLKAMNIFPVMADLREADLPDESADLVFSNGVLEQVPKHVLQDLFRVFSRITGRASVISHHIGIADEFARLDHSITRFNYMRFSSRAWQWLDSPMITQNRLKSSDYQAICQDAGFEIVDAQEVLGSEHDLDRIKLAAEFSHYSRRDLLVLDLWLIARPPLREGCFSN